MGGRAGVRGVGDRDVQQDLSLNHERLSDCVRDLRPSRNGPIVTVLSDGMRSASSTQMLERVPLFDPRTAGWDD